MSEKEHEFKPDDLKEIMNTISEKIPALVSGLTDSIYGKDASAKFGTAVANFYKTLKDSGMTDEQAFKLTEQYMSSLNLGGMIAKAFSHRGEHEE
jgi:flavodoxin